MRSSSGVDVIPGMYKSAQKIQEIIKGGDLESFKSLLNGIHGIDLAVWVAKWGNQEHARILVESKSDYLDILFTSAFRYNLDICIKMVSTGYKMKRYLNLFLLEESIKENRPDLVTRALELTGDRFIKHPHNGIRGCISTCIEDYKYEEVIRLLIKAGYLPTENDLLQSIKSRSYGMFLAVLDGCSHDFMEFHVEILKNFKIDVGGMSRGELINNLVILSIHHE